MSCRTTSGGSVSTTLARVYTGLSDKEIQHIFHALKREGSDLPPPSELEMTAWRDRQQDLLDRARRMNDAKRDGLRNKLFRSRSEPVPDGGTFYAWSRIEARARQEVAIRSVDPEVSGVIDLEPAGSQRHLYELDEHGLPAKVWYASYGSNLHRDRFLTYIKGGRPEGSTRVYDGCRDQAIPDEDIAIRVPGARPHFALTSRVWRGGIAFIDAHKGETATGLGRAYAVSREQFEDVVAQENGLKAGDCADIPYADVLDTGRVVTGTGPYETLLHIGDYNGAPVLTFTAPFSTRDALGRKGQVTRAGVRMPVLTNKPSPAYLRMIGSGLNETFGMDEVAQADYLRGCPGGDRYTRQQIVQILRSANPEPAQPVPGTGGGSTQQTLPTADGGQITYTKRAVDAGSPLSPTFSGRSGASGSTAGYADENRRYRGERVEAQPRSARPKVVPTVRGFYPAVKTYDSGEEREEGLRRWNAHLRDARNLRDRMKRNIETGAGTWGKTDDEAAEVIANWRSQYDALVLRVDELNAKARHAKQQAPDGWYSPARLRTKQAWYNEQSRVLALLSIEERTIAAASSRLAYHAPELRPPHVGEATWERWRTKAEGEVTRARAVTETLTSRLDEITTHLDAD